MEQEVKQVVKPFTEYPDLVEMDFDQLCAERQELNELKRSTEARLKDLNQQIAATLQVAGLEKNIKVDWNGTPVSWYTGRGPSRLDAKILLEKGVLAETIASATVPGKTYETVRFGKEE